MIYSPFDKLNKITNFVIGILNALMYVLIIRNHAVSNWWVLVPILMTVLLIARFMTYESLLNSCYYVIKDFIENGVHFDENMTNTEHTTDADEENTDDDDYQDGGYLFENIGNLLRSISEHNKQDDDNNNKENTK